MKQVHVGKNVVRIMNREFPVDTELSMVILDQEHCAWMVDSRHQSHPFMPIQDDLVTTETYRTYSKALSTSIAFNQRGKMRELFAKKEKGVKIIPGHGVFILPSKMLVEGMGTRSIRIRVFKGSERSMSFQSSNYSDMVAAATQYYCEHIREYTESVNDSLYYPVEYNRSEVREYNGIILPNGVTVDNRFKHHRVKYNSLADGQSQIGTAKTMKELKEFIDEAEAFRRKEQQLEAIYRFVTPKYIQLSQYMRTL